LGQNIGDPLPLSYLGLCRFRLALARMVIPLLVREGEGSK